MAAADTTPPVLTSLTFPATIDAGDTYVYPAFTAGASDSGTGIDHVTVTLDRPRLAEFGPTITIGGLRALFAEGPQTATPFFGQGYFGEGTASGTYRVTGVEVVDRAGNVAAYKPAQLAALGIATSFTVTGPTPADLVAPTLASLGLPDTVDVTGGGASATLLADVRDAGAGPFSAQLTLDHGAGPVNLYQQGEAISGALFLPTDAQPGTYHVTAATVTDRQGNSRGYTADELAALGTRTSFTVLSNAAPDTTAPVLTALSIPAAIDVTAGGLSMPIRASVTETGAGVGQIALALDRPITLDRETSYASHSNTPIGGPALFGTLVAGDGRVPGSNLTLVKSDDGYSFRYGGYGDGIPVSALTAAGTVHVIGATVTDLAGNISRYDAAQLAALGANTTIAIAADGTAPALTGFAVAPFVIRNGAIGITASATDTGTGPSQILVHTTDPLVNGPYNSGYDQNHLVGRFTNGTAALSGNANGLSAGSHGIIDVIVQDGGGNATFYSADQLRAAGYRTSFTVVGPPTDDFDGNGLTDLLWRNTGGAITTWSSNGVGAARERITQNSYAADVAPSWHPGDTLDWNGDGKADLLWRNDDGQLAIWAARPGGFDQGAYITDVETRWHVAGTGEINGGGGADILWRSDDGALSTWLAAGNDFQKNSWSRGPVDPAWQVEGLGDFTGDGLSDILWRNTSGAVSVWRGTGNGFAEAGSLVTEPIPRSWHVAGIGDFNGDGRDDILWRGDDGQVTVWQGGATGFDRQHLEAAAATSWHVAATGDYNGDHLSDVLWRNDAGAVSIWNSTGDGWAQNSYYDAGLGGNWALIGHAFPL